MCVGEEKRPTGLCTNDEFKVLLTTSKLQNKLNLSCYPNLRFKPRVP